MATLYVRRFNTGEAIDNYYVTPNFIEIDRARALNGLPTLLPFQPIERKSIIYTCTRRLMFKEWISGKGFLNDLLRNILKTFEPLTDKEQRDDLWRHCFKQPIQPRYDIFWFMFIIYIVS
uniref:Dendritic cell-specific transmembrane protein-like domain-containing protein n=1 Tax=Meloidogyne incognita TaxID=6306 RepID=A0A914NY78_MELIC